MIAQPDLFGLDPIPASVRRRSSRIPAASALADYRERVERTMTDLADKIADAIDDLRHELDRFDDGEVGMAIDVFADGIGELLDRVGDEVAD